MLMPIVSRNEMAMNESIAAACCYNDVIGDAQTSTFKVFYGGTIGYAKKETPGDALGVNPIWLMFPYDINGVTASSTLAIANVDAVADVPSTPENEAVAAYSTYSINGGTPYRTFEEALAAAGMSKGANCTHAGNDRYTCKYYTTSAGATLYENQHYGSTVAHNGYAVGVTHTATRWAS